MGLGWGQLGGAVGKVIDHFIDPIKSVDRKIEAKQAERKRILSEPSTSKNQARLTAVDNELVGLRSKRDRLLRRA